MLKPPLQYHENLKPESALFFGAVFPFVQPSGGPIEQSISEVVRRFERSRAGFQCAGTSRRGRAWRLVFAGCPSSPRGSP
jgi:hypothetical protein